MIVIKSKLSGYFYKQFGMWTPDPLQAISFADEWDARGFIRHERIEDVVVTEAEPVLAVDKAA